MISGLFWKFWYFFKISNKITDIYYYENTGFKNQACQNWYLWILLMVRTPWGACSPKIFFWRWVCLLSRYGLPKGAKMAKMAVFTNKRNFFPRDDLKHSKNQSGPKWPHLSIFSLKFWGNWRSGPPGCGYVSLKFVGGPEMCFYCKIRNFYIFMVHFF